MSGTRTTLVQIPQTARKRVDEQVYSRLNGSWRYTICVLTTPSGDLEKKVCLINYFVILGIRRLS